MHAVGGISKQCEGAKWTFCQKCPGVVRVLTAPGAFSQTRLTPPCNSRLPQDIHGNPLAKKRHFRVGKTGCFSLLQSEQQRN